MKSSLTGIVLTGGKSRRMGTDKALLMYKNRPLISHVIQALEGVTKEIYLIGGHGEKYEFLGKKQLTDLLPNSGPLGGLYTGLYYSEALYNIVLACDTPLINQSVLNVLIDGMEEHLDGVQLQHGDQKMPLIALYKKDCMHHFETLLKAGELKLQTAIASLNMKTILVPEHLQHCILNVNTKEDLALLESRFSD